MYRNKYSTNKCRDFLFLVQVQYIFIEIKYIRSNSKNFNTFRVIDTLFPSTSKWDGHKGIIISEIQSTHLNERCFIWIAVGIPYVPSLLHKSNIFKIYSLLPSFFKNVFYYVTQMSVLYDTEKNSKTSLDESWDPR